MWVGIILAILLKADLLAALQRLDAPWETLGWLRMQGSMWVWAPETGGIPTALYAVFGSIVTGAALGFGSKFWHETLDAVLELRNMAKLKNKKTRGDLPPNAEPEQAPGGDQ